jgi:hypothetical protein
MEIKIDKNSTLKKKLNFFFIFFKSKLIYNNEKKTNVHKILFLKYQFLKKIG